MSKRTNSEIKAAIESNAKALFEALVKEDFATANDIEKSMVTDKELFDSQSKKAHLDKHSTFMDFLRDPSYDVIVWKPVRDKDTLIDVEVSLKPVDLKVTDVFTKVQPAMAGWFAYVEQLTLRLDLKVAEDIGLSVQKRKEIEETLYMRRGGRTVELGQLDSNTSIDKALKLTIRALTNEVTEEQVEKAIKSYDRKFLLYSVTQRGGKSKMRLLDPAKVVNFVFLDIMGCHWANRPYTVDYKKDKDLAAASAATTVQNPNPNSNSNSESKSETETGNPTATKDTTRKGGKGGKGNKGKKPEPVAAEVAAA